MYSFRVCACVQQTVVRLRLVLSFYCFKFINENFQENRIEKQQTQKHAGIYCRGKKTLRCVYFALGMDMTERKNQTKKKWIFNGAPILLGPREKKANKLKISIAFNVFGLRYSQKLGSKKERNKNTESKRIASDDSVDACCCC